MESKEVGTAACPKAGPPRRPIDLMVERGRARSSRGIPPAMDHAVQVSLIRRALALLERGTAYLGPDVAEQPVHVYASPERLALERERLFRRVPIVLADAASLREPGSFVTHDALGIPILLVAGNDGEIRGLLNVCRHRGARLTEGPLGTARASFRCPYHGWTYDLEGALRHVPHAYGFPDGHCARTALVPFPVRARHGLVWSDPGPDLDTYLGPLGAELGSWGLDRRAAIEPLSARYDANWKLLVDGALESYHFRWAHGDTVYPLFHDNLALVDAIGPHQRVVFVKRAIAEVVAREPARWNILSAANIAYLIFPNTLLLVQKDRATRLSFFPEAPDRSLRLGATLTGRRPATEAERAAAEEGTRLIEAALGEDFALAASIQRGIGSGANQALLFGRFEHGLRAFHRAIEERLAG